MSRYYRNRMPKVMAYWISLIEKAMIPLMIFQFIRTLIFPSILDILILGGLVGLFFAFQSKWI